MSHEHPEQQDVYVRTDREEVAPSIPRDAASALDVGCALGGFGDSLRAALGPSARLVAVEAVPAAAEVAARTSEFDEVLTGYFPDVFRGREDRFDLVCFNDVLEHIVDPWAVLAQTHEFLTPAGQVLACIPNIQYGPVVWDLIRGDFSYVDRGILDRTHVRFFTRKTIVELFNDTGYRVVHIRGVNNIIKDRPRLGRGHVRKLRHLLGPAQWMQFVVLATPTSGPRS